MWFSFPGQIPPCSRTGPCPSCPPGRLGWRPFEPHVAFLHRTGFTFSQTKDEGRPREMFTPLPLSLLSFCQRRPGWPDRPGAFLSLPSPLFSRLFVVEPNGGMMACLDPIQGPSPLSFQPPPPPGLGREFLDLRFFFLPLCPHRYEWTVVTFCALAAIFFCVFFFVFSVFFFFCFFLVFFGVFFFFGCCVFFFLFFFLFL